MRKNNVIQQMQQSAIKFDLKLMQELQSEVVNLARQAEELESLIEDLSAWFSHKGQYAVSVVECQQGRNSSNRNQFTKLKLKILLFINVFFLLLISLFGFSCHQRLIEFLPDFLAHLQ